MTKEQLDALIDGLYASRRASHRDGLPTAQELRDAILESQPLAALPPLNSLREPRLTKEWLDEVIANTPVAYNNFQTAYQNNLNGMRGLRDAILASAPVEPLDRKTLDALIKALRDEADEVFSKNGITVWHDSLHTVADWIEGNSDLATSPLI